MIVQKDNFTLIIFGLVLSLTVFALATIILLDHSNKELALAIERTTNNSIPDSIKLVKNDNTLLNDSNGEENDYIIPSNWDTYTNEVGNFSLSYPSSFYIGAGEENCGDDAQSGIDCLLFSLNYFPDNNVNYMTESDMIVRFFRVPGVEKSLSEYFADHKEITTDYIKIMLEQNEGPNSDLGPGFATQEFWNQETTVAGQNAIVQYSKADQPIFAINKYPYTNKDYYLEKDGIIYEIKATVVTSAVAKDLLYNFDAIVSSITFNN